MSKKQGRLCLGKKAFSYIMLGFILLISSGCSSKESVAAPQAAAAPTSSSVSAEPETMDFFAKQSLKKAQHADKKEPKILFLGNSYIYTNELPQMLAALAKSGGIQADVAEYSDGGYSLELFADPTDELGSRVKEELLTYE